jgi:hypothetical protein
MLHLRWHTGALSANVDWIGTGFQHQLRGSDRWLLVWMRPGNTRCRPLLPQPTTGITKSLSTLIAPSRPQYPSRCSREDVIYHNRPLAAMLVFRYYGPHRSSCPVTRVHIVQIACVRHFAVLSRTMAPTIKSYDYIVIGGGSGGSGVGIRLPSSLN